MADPRAFISFDFDHDSDQRVLFAGQSKHSKTPFSVQDWSSKEELAQSKWEAALKDKINKCNLMVVLVGKNTYWATGVAKEITFANGQNVPFFGVYVDGAGSSTSLPSGLNRNRVISWTWDGIHHHKKCEQKSDEIRIRHQPTIGAGMGCVFFPAPHFVTLVTAF